MAWAVIVPRLNPNAPWTTEADLGGNIARDKPEYPSVHLTSKKITKPGLSWFEICAMSSHRWKAVIFDMDGVVFNSESIFRRAWMIAFDEFGFPFDDALFRSVVGCSAAACRTALVTKYGRRFDCDAFVARKNFLFRDLRQGSLAYRFGFTELITEIRRSLLLRTALATSSSAAEVESNFDLLPAHADDFELVVTREHVQNQKPHAECYLTTSALLSVAPSDCLVVEDSVVGAEAAIAAGCSVILAPEPDCSARVGSARLLAKVADLGEVVEFLS